jgi:hypothetical protein
VEHGVEGVGFFAVEFVFEGADGAGESCGSFGCFV